jgi:L-lactate permease
LTLLGTPIWFGFGNLGLSEDDYVEISFKGGVSLTICAYLVYPTLVMSILCPFKVIRENFIFVLLSLSSVMVPVLGLSFVTYEFPSLIGGMIGCIISAGLIVFRLGLKEYNKEDSDRHLMISTTASKSLVQSIAKTREAASLQASANFEKELEALDKAQDEAEHSDVIKNENESNYQEKNVNQDDNDDEKNNEEQPMIAEKDDAFDEEGNERSFMQSFTPHLYHDSRKDDGEALADLFDVEQALGPRKSGAAYYRELIGRTSPLWGTVLLLIVTRVQQIGLRALLVKREPYLQVDFGTYGIFRLSASLVFQLLDILTHPDLSWKYELLYVPFIIPFVLMSLITMVLYRTDLQSSPKSIFGTCIGRLKKPAVALLGALALVQLMIKEGSAAPADIIGNNLSTAVKGGWIAFTALIGTLGSFFSGSTTISNLTFGGIQHIAAETIGTSMTAMLALQAVGASAGNGVCLNNIISAMVSSFKQPF